MKVNRIFFREMGSYNDMFARPYESNYSSRLGDELETVTRGGRDINPGVLAGVASKILRPSANIERPMHITNGWGTTRFMFIMEVEVRRTETASDVEIITGYTDHAEGITHSGKISGDMMLHFSSTFTLHRLDALTSRGFVTTSRIKDASQIVARRENTNYDPYDTSVGTLTMRPEDLFINGTAVPEFDKEAGQLGFKDMRAGFAHGLKLSKRDNTLAPNYLTKSMSAYRDAAGDDDGFIDDDPLARLISARGKVKERLVQSDPVLQEIAKDSNIMSCGYVTYGELLRMNRNLDQVVEIHFNKPGSRIHQRGDSENWNGADSATVAATIVANAIPNYLMEAMYASATLVCTNETRDGTFFTKAPVLYPFSQGTDIDENYNYLISKINHELLPTLVVNDQMSLSVEIECAIYGDTRIRISIDQGPWDEFVFPTFCDALVSPIITDRKVSLDALSKDIISIVDGLGSSEVPRNSSPIITDLSNRPRGKHL